MSQALRERLNTTTPSALAGILNILAFGDPGIGKTMFGATAQDHKLTKPMLLLDIEGGTTTISNRQDIDVVVIRSMKELEKTHHELHADEGKFYKTVMLDNITELQKLDLVDIMRQAYNKNPEKVDKDVPSQREWGITLNHMRAIVRAFRDLPINTIMTAHAYYEVEEGTNITKVYPDISGKGRIQIPGFMDIVGYYHMGRNGNDQVRRMQFTKTARILAKDRTQSLGDFVDEPTVPKLFDLISKKES